MSIHVIHENMRPKADLPFTEKEWKEIGQIVKLDIQRGILAQRQVDGTSYAPLKAKTIQKKQKKGSPMPEKRLIDTRNLEKNQVITPRLDGVELTIGPTRAEIGVYQQLEPGRGNVATYFFGISENASRAIVSYVDKLIDRWLRASR